MYKWIEYEVEMHDGRIVKYETLLECEFSSWEIENGKIGLNIN